MKSSLSMLVASALFGAFNGRSLGNDTGGDGNYRAEARLIEHRKKFDGIEKSHVPTRQGQRAFDRAMRKMERSARKQDAMIRKLPGGTAAVM